MARALFGHLGYQGYPSSSTEQLRAENTRLRQRVGELEAQLAELRAAHARALDDSSLELELHRLTGDNQPALA